MTDEITLTIPRDRALYGVAHLVLGGLGIRLNLTIEHLEDLQLAARRRARARARRRARDDHGRA